MRNPSPYELFHKLHPGGLPRGQLALYTRTLRGAKERSYWCRNRKEADRLVAKYSQTRQVRLSVALHDPKKALAIARGRRRRAALGAIRGCEGSATALPALWAVITWAGRASAGRSGAVDLPPSRQQGLDLLDALPVLPSIVVAAGGKIWVYWPLDKPWLFDPENPKDPEREAAKSLLRRVHWAIESRAADHGWQLDAGGQVAGDLLAAAFPIPGSPTGGRVSGPRANCLSFPMVSGDGRFRRRDFESLPEPPADEDQPWRDELAEPAARPSRPPRDFRPVAAGCSWIRHCRRHVTTLSQEQWQKAVRLLSECATSGADPRRLVHAVSVGHPGYDPFETDDQLARALRDRRGSITCREIGQEPGVVDQHCSSCPHQGRIRRPIDLAPEAAANAPGAEPPADLPAAPTAASGAAAPAVAPPAVPAPWDDELLASLEEVLHALGGAATARQLTRALQTDSARYPAFAAAFRGLFPDLRPGDREAITRLGYRLRALKGRVLGGRVLTEARRTRDGVTWAIQRIQAVPRPSDPGGGASP